jgi:hypothetical protein
MWKQGVYEDGGSVEPFSHIRHQRAGTAMRNERDRLTPIRNAMRNI